MSRFSVGSCLHAGVSPPQGTRFKINVGFLIVGLLILLFQNVAKQVSDEGAFAVFAVMVLQNIFVQPLFVGLNLFAVRSQWRDNAHTVRFRTLFSAYERIVPLGIIAVLLSIPSLMSFKYLFPLFANKKAIAFLFHQYSWVVLVAMLIFGLLFLMMFSLFINYVQLFIVDKNQSVGGALNSAFKHFFNAKVLFTVTFSYLVFNLYLFVPFILTLIVLHFAGTLLGYLAVIASLVWIFYLLPGVVHLVVHPYARLIEDSASTGQDSLDDEELEDEDSVNESESDSQSDNEEWIQGK